MTRTNMPAFPWFLLIIVLSGCNVLKQSAKKNEFVKGADIGWLQQMEATGYNFYNDHGKKRIISRS